MSSVFLHLDEVVDRILRLREELLREADTPSRADRLASVFESEARAWSQLYELSSARLVWRAALAAEAMARANAAWWEARAAEERAGSAAAGGPAAGRVGVPRPMALTTSGGGR
jgi:hypothetical protein